MLVYCLGMSLATHRVVFWVKAVCVSAAMFYVNIELAGPLQHCIGMMVSFTVAVLAAGRTSIQDKQSKPVKGE